MSSRYSLRPRKPKPKELLRGRVVAPQLPETDSVVPSNLIERFSFLAFPAEIRVQIYRHILHRETFVAIDGDAHDNVFEKILPRELNLGILWACRTSHQEVRAIIFSHYTFCFRNCLASLAILEAFTRPALRDIQSLYFDCGFPGDLFDCSRYGLWGIVTRYCTRLNCLMLYWPIPEAAFSVDSRPDQIGFCLRLAHSIAVQSPWVNAYLSINGSRVLTDDVSYGPDHDDYCNTLVARHTKGLVRLPRDCNIVVLCGYTDMGEFMRLRDYSCGSFEFKVEEEWTDPPPHPMTSFNLEWEPTFDDSDLDLSGNACSDSAAEGYYEAG